MIQHKLMKKRKKKKEEKGAKKMFFFVISLKEKNQNKTKNWFDYLYVFYPAFDNKREQIDFHAKSFTCQRSGSTDHTVSIFCI